MTAEPDVTITREEMIAIRDYVRSKLLHDYHAHLLTSRLYLRFGNAAAANVDKARASELKSMIAALDEEPEPPRGTSIRLHTTDDTDDTETHDGDIPDPDPT